MKTPPPNPEVPVPDRITLRVGGAKMSIDSGRSYTIGRDPGNDLRLAHSSIAGRHAKLLLQNGQVVLEDLDSPTGVWLGEHRLESEQVLLPGMKVRIGDIELEFQDLESQNNATSEGSAATKLGLVPGQIPTPHNPRLHEETFAEIMAEQLRHAPWFGLSIGLHALLLFLLWVLLPPPKSGTSERVLINLGANESDNDDTDEEDIPEEETIEVEEVDDIELQELAEENQLLAELNPEGQEADDWGEETTVLSNEASIFQRLGGSKKDDILSGTGGGADKSVSREFKKSTNALRRSGLDICFVFDSTGSMGPVLKTTKESITKMVDVLHALVPNSRIGIVTFRDKDDDYLTRVVPVSNDYYRSINFVQTIEADGGDDRPEAVYEALKVAIKQPWGRHAKRIIVLIGDAPPHRKTTQKISSMVKGFTRNQSATVHTITTSPDIFGEIDEDTERDFAHIAKTGNGHALTFDKEGQLLKQVLSIAFGRDYRESIDEIYRRVETRNRRVSPRTRDMVRRADTKAIAAQLQRKQIKDDLVRLLCKTKDPKVAEVLIEILAQRGKSAAGRNAAAFALQQILQLSEPPYDAESGKPINREMRAFLARRVRQRLGTAPR